jgi:hypothetical protein
VENVFVEWQRGSTVSKGGRKVNVPPNQPLTQVGELFKKISIFYLSEKQNTYSKKSVVLRLKASGAKKD